MKFHLTSVPKSITFLKNNTVDLLTTKHTDYLNMKHFLFIAFVALFTCKAVAQKKTVLEENYSTKPGVADAITTNEANAYVGHRKFLCGRVSKFNLLSKSTGLCELRDDGKGQVYIIISMQKFKTDTNSIVGHMLCIDGTLKLFRGKPAIFVKKAKQVGYRALY